MVWELLRGGARIDQANTDGYSPLNAASQQGHLEVVCELLRGGASIDQAEKDDCTLFTWRASRVAWRWCVSFWQQELITPWPGSSTREK